MTELEKKVLTKIIDTCKDIVIPSVEMDKNFKMTEANKHEDIKRWFASEDFRKGWELCYKNMEQFLSFLMTASTKDLKKYL